MTRKLLMASVGAFLALTSSLSTAPAEAHFGGGGGFHRGGIDHEGFRGEGFRDGRFHGGFGFFGNYFGPGWYGYGYSPYYSRCYLTVYRTYACS
jgi:hypothetical protein